MSWLIAAALLSFVLISALAVAPPAAAAPLAAGQVSVPFASASTANLGDPQELESFMDGVVNTQLGAYHIPGETVAVVKDGQLLFAKGYGSADLAANTPVQADTTTFRVGSVSKLFTWTAVMQLKEQGKLDLNADVNKYLKTFQIPDTYPGHPITLAHLLTHTPGFEDRGIGTMVHEGDIQPLSQWLAHNIPARVRPPGQVTSYSNYGAALAGYIVEQVSGQPFDDYIEQHILRPLNMSHSTLRQPVPPAMAANVAQGYSFASGTFTKQPFEYIAPWPAGSMSATATDMANFMIAQLQNGRFGDTRILQDATAQQMHTQHFTNDPRVPGFDYGFYESRIAGQRIIGHGGDTAWFHTELALLPDQDVGLFVSVNSINGASAPAALVDAFVHRYYSGGSETLPTKALPGYTDRAAKMAGSYWVTRHSYTTLEKVSLLFSTMTVTPTGNGHLTISPGLGGASLDVVEVSPWVFRQVRPQDFGLDAGTIVFQTDASGNVTSVLLGNLPMMAWQRIAWYETPGFHFLVLLACLLLFLAALIIWPIRYLRSPQGRRQTRSVAGAVAAWIARVTRRGSRQEPGPLQQPAPNRPVAEPVAVGSTDGHAAPERTTDSEPTVPPQAPVSARVGEQPGAQIATMSTVVAPERGNAIPGAHPGSDSRLAAIGGQMSWEGLGRVAHGLAWVVCALFVLFTLGFIGVFSAQTDVAYGATPLLIAGLLLGVLAAILSIGVVACAILVWRERLWNRAGRIFYTLVALAAVAFVVELAFWNLLGVHV